MKIFISITIFLFLIQNEGYTQNKECLQGIKTGTFTYDYSGTLVTLIRTKNKQVSTINNGKSKIISKIKWVNDSEFILTFIKAINANGCLKKGDKITNTITACDEKTYTLKSSSENCGDSEIVFTIIK